MALHIKASTRDVSDVAHSAAHEASLEESIRHGLEDFGGAPQSMHSFLDELGDAQPSRSDFRDFIWETAAAWSPELRAHLSRRAEDTSATLAADIAEEARSSRDETAAGCALGRSRIVFAEDPAHQAIADVVARLAGQLGLDPSVVVVDLSQHATDLARRAGTIAVALEGRIHLDENRFDPYSPRGREVLAHEMTHLAQWRLGRDAAHQAPVPRVLAEREASAIGRCFVAGHALPRPVIPLNGGEPAAFCEGATLIGALAGLGGVGGASQVEVAMGPFTLRASGERDVEAVAFRGALEIDAAGLQPWLARLEERTTAPVAPIGPSLRPAAHVSNARSRGAPGIAARATNPWLDAA